MNQEAGPLRHDLAETNVIFIHSALDDFGLTAAEFRVYAHLSRRAGKDGAYPGIDSMAQICCLSKPTVISAIRRLEEMGMLLVVRKDGERNRYQLTRPSKWHGARLKIGNGPGTGKNESTDRSKVGNGTGKNEVTKESPKKEDPKKEVQVSLFDQIDPENKALSGQEGFVEEWRAFRLHRKKLRCPMTERAEELILESLAERPKDAVDALRFAQRKGWRGFEWEWYDKAKRGESSGGRQPRERVDYNSLTKDTAV